MRVAVFTPGLGVEWAVPMHWVPSTDGQQQRDAWLTGKAEGPCSPLLSWPQQPPLAFAAGDDRG